MPKVSYHYDMLVKCADVEYAITQNPHYMWEITKWHSGAKFATLFPSYMAAKKFLAKACKAPVTETKTL
jgi:hypothetical protein